MIIKVCGVKTEENINDLSQVPIDMIGLNFYEKSARYVDKAVIPQWYDALDDKVSRVGVFVNMELDDVLDFVDEYRLDYVQLHGDEDLLFAKMLKKHVSVIKVCKVGTTFDASELTPFSFVDYILFDTDTKMYGGSGQKFDWNLLASYALDVPFLIGGGIGLDDVNQIKALSHPLFVGIDINSKFESSPGIKDVNMVSKFVSEIR